MAVGDLAALSRRTLVDLVPVLAANDLEWSAIPAAVGRPPVFKVAEDLSCEEWEAMRRGLERLRAEEEGR